MDIKATYKGSFIVDLILGNGGDLLTQAIDLLNGKESKAHKSLIEIFDGVYGAILFTKTVGKRIIKSKKDLPSGEVKITLDD
ncbi:hypothetical protein [Enterococcus sp. DIV0086]|uniref:hypothetical protein n=1 Tax=Enterococcus sp. DIV0086 TaxID=2774655 RepID=UPI003D2B89C2